MAQQFINYGSFPDDANADAIRTAFIKVDQNFTDLYSNGVAGVTAVNASDGIVTRRTGSNVFVAANIFQIQLTSNANSMVFTTGATVDQSDAIYSQGTATLAINPAANFQVQNVYMSGNLFMGAGSPNAITRGPGGIAQFHGDGSGLTNIIARPTGSSTLAGQIQVAANTANGLIIQGSNVLSVSGNTLEITGSSGIQLNADSGITLTTTVSAGNIRASANIIGTNLTVNSNAIIAGTTTLADSNIAGILRELNVTESTNSTTGAVILSGGIGIAKSASIGANLRVSGNANITGNTNIDSTVNSTSQSTGALVVLGGVGIGGNIYAGNANVGNTSVSGSLTVTSNANISGNTSVTGTLTSIGDANLAGNLVVGASTTLSQNVTVAGNIIASANINAGSNLNITTVIAQSGQLLFANGTRVNGTANVSYIGTALTVSGSDYNGTSNSAGFRVFGGGEIAGNLYVGGSVTFGGISTANVDASDATFSGNLEVTGNVSAKGGNTTVQFNNDGNVSGATNVEYANGNLQVSTFIESNAIVVTGTTTLSGNLIANGKSFLNDTVNVDAALNVSELSNLTGVIINDLTSTRLVFAGTNGRLVDSSTLTFDTGTGLLSVIGNAAVSNSIQANTDIVAGNSIFANVNFSGNANINIGGNIASNGFGQFTGNISTGANITATGNISAAANIFSSANVTASSNLVSLGNLNVSGNGAITGNTAVTGFVTVGNTLTVTGNGTFSNNLAVTKDLTVTGNATVTSNTILNGATLTVAGNTTFNNTVLVSGVNVLQSRTLSTGAAGTAGTITGNWSLASGSRLNATYADLAEWYSADESYAPGTVLAFGGVNEVTIAEINSTAIVGVVTTNPAYVMNSNIVAQHPVAIALVGRVPTKVTGHIHKGDMLVSAGNGFATACSAPRIGQVIGKSLEDFSGETGTIEIAVSRH